MEKQRVKNSQNNLEEKKKKPKFMPPNTYYNAVIITATWYLKNSKWANGKKRGKKPTNTFTGL